MEQPVMFSQAFRSRKPRTSFFSSLGQRKRSILFGVVAASVVIGLIALGSQGFHWFDPALIGYAVASVFAVGAITYKYSFWLARPPTRRYWQRSWQLLLSYEHLRRYTLLIPQAIAELFLQQFIRKRSWYRWVMHQCIFWGVVLSCALTFPLTFGWLHFTQISTGQYRLWSFGWPMFLFAANSFFGFLMFHMLDWTALLLIIGLILAFYRRFRDLALIAVQRFRFDILPLVLLMAIAVTGLALTADSFWLHGAYYGYISLIHEIVVVFWLISLPFGKFFHIIERPATVGIALYQRVEEDTAMQQCVRCEEEFAPARFVEDLKKTLYEVGENYTLGSSAEEYGGATLATTQLWWQDLCPTCKRVMRAQANLAALGRGGNQFL